MPPLEKLYAFIDTSIFLEYQEYTQLEWPKILDASAVCLVVVPMVRKEIERHRTNPGSPRRQKRARDISGKLRDLAFSVADGQEAGISERPNVTYLELAQSALLSKYPDLSPETQDDHIIASVIDFWEKHSERNILLLTGDTGLALKARHYNLPQLYLPDDYRLPDEPTLEQRKVRELDRRVKTLENPSPTLEVDLKGALEHNLTFPAETSIDNFKDEQKMRVVSILEDLKSFAFRTEQSAPTELSRYANAERPTLFPLNFAPRVKKNLEALGIGPADFRESLLQPIRLEYERSPVIAIAFENRPQRLIGPDIPWYKLVQRLDGLLEEVIRNIHNELRGRQYKALTLSIKNVGGVAADELDIRLYTLKGDKALTESLDTWYWSNSTYGGYDIPPSWRQGYLYLSNQLGMEVSVIKPGDSLSRQVGFVRVPEATDILELGLEIFGRNLAAPLKDVFSVHSRSQPTG